MIVYLAWKQMRPQYGDSTLIGIYDTEQKARDAAWTAEHTLPGYQSRFEAKEVQ